MPAHTDVFADLYPFLYALTFRDGGYERMSEASAAFAEAAVGSLSGRHVLDVGSAYGTTACAIAKWGPSSITAVEQSPQMVACMRAILQGTEHLRTWMRSCGAGTILEPLGYFNAVHTHFEQMRAAYQGSMFCHRGGTLTIHEGDILELDKPQPLGEQRFDVIIGNNCIHWPIRQWVARAFGRDSQYDDLTVSAAIGAALEPLATRLAPGGTLVLMEPSDFMVIDDDLELEEYIEAHAMQAHPCFKLVQGQVSSILAREYGIQRLTPARTPIFKRSELARYAHRAGLELLDCHHMEGAYQNDPLEIFLSRLPMQMSGVQGISVEQKIAILREVKHQLMGTLLEEEHQPVFPHWFFLVMGKA